MSTQNISATISGSWGGKVFTDSATDGRWDGNNMLDSIASAQIGQVMPGQSINSVAVVYTAGACLWRIQDQNTLAVKRYGYAALVGTGVQSQTQIPAYTIAPADIFTVYPVAVNATAGDTENLSWLQMSNGIEPFGVTTVEAATATEMKSLVTTNGIGTFYGQNLTGFTIQAEDGATVNQVTLIGADGGTLGTWYGSVRLSGGANPYSNLVVTGLNIPITKGMVLNCASTTGS
jgi:hypothetical protein